jgi:hypothetical protein
MPLPDYRWAVAIPESTYPVERWTLLRTEGGGPYKFVEQFEAEALVTRLQKVQPHVTYRVVPYSPARR